MASPEPYQPVTRKPSPWKGAFVCLVIGCGGWIALNASSSEYSPPLITKRETPPPSGVIGGESRVPLADFVPEDPSLFPGWEDAIAAVVRISCRGGMTGGGVLIGDGDRMLTAAHVFLNEDGSQRGRNPDCVAVHTGGDVVLLDTAGLKAGPFRVPEALITHLSVPITRTDWAVVRLSRVPQGARPLPIAAEADLTLEEGHPILNVTGGNDTYRTDGFLAQICQYRGVPPTTSDLDENGEVVGRLAEPRDTFEVARYDCDSGSGASGSPMIGWSEGGQPMIWGVLTDSLRGRERCPDVGRTFCYTAGPLAPAMDIVP
ncbi:serine protease [Gymnodinialimonas hymeniacidonis]|uniref:trypsin-like serine peptidase n=1 Tax=Gymnodinialimonas hymeniacidonis TaxID=3126508 RepID=UPI0034C690D9